MNKCKCAMCDKAEAETETEYGWLCWTCHDLVVLPDLS